MYTVTALFTQHFLIEGAGGELKHDFLQEISLMKKVAQDCNPFVVNMIGCCTRSEPLALIMEFVSGGNLLEFLKSHRRKVINRLCLHIRLLDFMHYSGHSQSQLRIKQHLI